LPKYWSLAQCGEPKAGIDGTAAWRLQRIVWVKREAAIPTEIELKLAARATDLPELKRALIAMASVSAQEKLISTYYDTPDRALKQRGLTLRVREQNGHYTQTIKTGDPSGDLLSRGEWEVPVAGNRPDPNAADSEAHLPNDAAGNLQPLLVTTVTRAVFEIEPVPGTKVEAAVDEGEVRLVDKEKAEPIGEIELELKRGDATALYDLAARLLEVAPLRIETRSKWERGYYLAEGSDDGAPPAVHAERVELDADMTIEAALRQIGRNCLAQLLRNEPAVLSSELEGVHQMRVAVRRLRSAVSSLKNIIPQEDLHWITGELRWLGGALGPARNLDVFATELLPAARTQLPDEPGWEDLASTFVRLRHAAYDRIREVILSERYTAAMLRLLRWFEAPRKNGRPAPEPEPEGSLIGGTATCLLDWHRRKVKQRSKGFRRLPPHKRHKLRIAVKKLRYTIELFGSLLNGQASEEFVRRLKRAQADLGYANDVRVAHEFIIELFGEIEPRSSAAHAWISALEAHDQMLAGGERKLRRHLRRLNKAAPFWRG
jgi:inorganic triphosphatase YgiF